MTTTSTLNLNLAEIAPLVRAVRPPGEELEDSQILDIFARTAWCGIAEPGDRDAGRLIAANGAVLALEYVTTTSPSADEAVARWNPRVSYAAAIQALKATRNVGARVIVPGDAAWPANFGFLGDCAPHALWARGDVAVLAELCTRGVAVVGARAATGYGEHVAMQISADLVNFGHVIVSGAAYGIDGVAHRAALASGGKTVAFLAGGVDRFYPSGHDDLLNRVITSGGAVVSELPPGSPPTRWRFLQRNRLVAASSPITVVVEAGARSGSLNTAEHAKSLGAIVAAVPGPITSAASAGCHNLIREGALLVTNAAEIEEALA